MAKRSRLDIVADMLAAMQEKRGKMKPTHIMYRANLSHDQLKSYLEELIEKELVEKIEGGTTYFILTDKGHHFLQKLNEVKQFEKSFGF